MGEGFTKKQKLEMRKEVKIGFMEGSKELMKQIRNECMTKTECLSIHQGRHTAEAIHSNNGELSKEKLKFWGAITGLVLTVTTLITTISTVIVIIYIR